MTTLLAMDTTLGACSAAVVADGGVVARRWTAMARGHAEALMGMIDAVVAEAGIRRRALDGVAVTVGPGTFTGVRVGLAAARGLALALDRPLCGLSTLEALAAAAALGPAPPATVLAAIDARRGQLYVQSFRVGASDGCLLDPLDAPRAIAVEDASRAGLLDGVAEGVAGGGACVGTGAALIAGATDVRAGLPDAAVVGRYAQLLADDRWRARAAPLYVRAPDAVLPTPAVGPR